MKKIISFIKKEIVLCVATLLAIVTAFFNPPSKAYIDFIDFKVLALLFSLMLVVAGIRSFGIFTRLIEAITKKVQSTKALEFILVFICFFSSMIITNDVALITFVPFAIEMLITIGKKKHIIYIVVLQTIAANLGSMLTPIGNPQNIFIYNKYNMSMGEFFGTTIWYALLAMVVLAICICVLPNDKVEIQKENSEKIAIPIWKLLMLAVVFALCIACVMRVLDYRIMLGVSIVFIAIVNYKLFKTADYILLLTFVAFFIMAGNIKSIDAISTKLAELVAGREIYAGIISSQFISNVPAAVLLSNFTANGRHLLVGVSIGGLGTLIASMASLISFRYYSAIEDSKKGKYFGIFTGINILFLILMMILVFVGVTK